MKKTKLHVIKVFVQAPLILLLIEQSLSRAKKFHISSTPPQ